MSKSDILDDIIDIFIRRALDDEHVIKENGIKYSDNIMRGDKTDGIYASTSIRKQA